MNGPVEGEADGLSHQPSGCLFSSGRLCFSPCGAAMPSQVNQWEKQQAVTMDSVSLSEKEKSQQRLDSVL